MRNRTQILLKRAVGQWLPVLVLDESARLAMSRADWLYSARTSGPDRPDRLLRVLKATALCCSLGAAGVALLVQPVRAQPLVAVEQAEETVLLASEPAQDAVVAEETIELTPLDRVDVGSGVQPAPGAASADGAAIAAAAPLVATSPTAGSHPAGAAAVVIGDATASLLSLQRESQGRERPISGPEASLSYARYLKSFEYAIPEKYESNMNEVKQGNR